ncbi:MAG: hypothetical protein U9Q16_03015 [Patescibacteria group bacterium]|nr:hypothetical protein [Patescibacteria group bacterium]
MALFNVLKFNGEKEPFSFNKVYESAKRVGASKDFAKEIAEIVEKEAYQGIKTSEIFKKVKKLLKREKNNASLKFSLKEAMRKLGPTGFPFEKYISEIFSRNGFKTKLNQNIKGHCCKYEIDFLAEKENLLYVAECKYRNLSKAKVHSNIALANFARFIDIQKGNFLKNKKFKNLNIKSLLVTNTKFTRKNIEYSKCVGVELLGWNYPKKAGLERIIDDNRFYPITILPSLNNRIAEIFASKKMMLIQDISKINISNFTQKTGISKKVLEKLKKEAGILIDV